MSSVSLVEWFAPDSDDGVPEGHGCGYCKDNETNTKNKDGSKSHGFWAHQLSTTAYQLLIDRGWRRSGAYVYKPHMSSTCCPQYTIRLPVSEFKPSKSQRKVLKRMSKRLDVNTESLTWREILKIHRSKLEIKLVKVGSAEYKKTEAESHKVYKNYQVNIHKDEESEVTKRQWERFLCSPPRNFENTEHEKHGAYHQQYWLDGKLIAVGVVDWLDWCYSSVYLYYDTGYKDLSLGTFTALAEIDFCLENGIEFYYLGYYVPECPKMEYKSQYKPASLLCPVTLTWTVLDDRVNSLFKTKKYNQLSTLTKSDFMTTDVSLTMGLILYQRQVLPYCLLPTEKQTSIKQYNLFAKLLGKELLENHIAVYVSEY